MRPQRSSFFPVLFLALALAGAATAQDWQGGAAFGVRVTDEHGDAIAGAQVVARVSDVEATGPGPIETDGGGRAVVSGLREGEWFVEVSHGGYMLYSAYVSLKAGKKPIVGFSSQVNTKTSWAPMTVKFQKATADFSRTLSTTRRAKPKPPKVVREEPATPPKVVRPEPEPPKVVRPEPEPPKVVRPEPEAEMESEAAPSDPPPAPAEPVTLPEPEVETTPESPPASDPPATTEPPAAAVEPTDPTPPAQAPPVSEAPVSTTTVTTPPVPATEPPVVMPPPADEPPAEPAPAQVTIEPSPEPAPPTPADAPEPEEDPVPTEESTVLSPPPAATVPSAAVAAAAVQEPAASPAADIPKTKAPEVEPSPPSTPPQPQPAPEPVPAEPEVIEPEVIEPSESVILPEPESEPAAEPPTKRAAPPAPSPSAPEAPDAEPAPAVPGRLPRFLRSAASGSCSECETGEWAIAAEQEAARASDVTSRSECNAAYLERVSNAAQMLADTPSERLDNYAGPVLTAMFRLDGQARDQVQDLLASVTDPESNCQMAGVVLPSNSSFSGYVLEAWDSLGGRACRAGLDCAVGRARWLEDPQIIEGAERVVVYDVFKNRSSRRERRLRMTIYFKPQDPAWVPRTR